MGVNMSQEFVRESDEEVTLREIRGNDHFARFYEVFQRYIIIRPTDYPRLLRDAFSVLPFVEDVEHVFEALAEYIEHEVNSRIGGDTRISVYFEHSPDFKSHFLVAKAHVRVGDEDLKVEVMNEDVFHWGEIAESREDFNETIEGLINDIVKRTNKVLAKLKKE